MSNDPKNPKMEIPPWIELKNLELKRRETAPTVKKSAGRKPNRFTTIKISLTMPKPEIEIVDALLVVTEKQFQTKMSRGQILGFLALYMAERIGLNSPDFAFPPEVINFSSLKDYLDAGKPKSTKKKGSVA